MWTHKNVVFLTLFALILAASSLLVVSGEIRASGALTQVTHASPELMKLAEEFRAFRSPLFRPRTWRPTHRVKGVADYASVVRSNARGFRDSRRGSKRSTPRAGRCTTRSTICYSAPRWTTWISSTGC